MNIEKQKTIAETVENIRDPMKRPGELERLKLHIKHVIACSQCGAEWSTFHMHSIVRAVRHALKRMKNKGHCDGTER